MKILKYLFLLLFAGVLFSCNDDDYEADKQFPEGGNVKILMASSLSYGIPYEVVSDGRKMFQSNYASFSKLYRYATGSHHFEINSILGDQKKNILNFDEAVAPNQNVTFFIVKDQAGTGYTTVRTVDNLDRPAVSKVKMRVANLGENVGDVDAVLTINGVEQKLFTSLKTGQVSDFTEISIPNSASSVNATLGIRLAGQTTNLKTLSYSLKSTDAVTFALIGVRNNTAAQPPITILADSNLQ